jgi:hypothetical protein
LAISSRITDECAQIKRRQHPVIRALKLFLFWFFSPEWSSEFLAPEYHVTHVGDLLMAVGLLAVCALSSWFGSIGFRQHV